MAGEMSHISHAEDARRMGERDRTMTEMAYLSQYFM
jgi:hypothetical protein